MKIMRILRWWDVVVGCIWLVLTGLLWREVDLHQAPAVVIIWLFVTAVIWQVLIKLGH